MEVKYIYGIGENTISMNKTNAETLGIRNPHKVKFPPKINYMETLRNQKIMTFRIGTQVASKYTHQFLQH